MKSLTNRISMPPFQTIEQYADERKDCYQGAVGDYVKEEILKAYLVGHEVGFDFGMRNAINVIENCPYIKPKIIIPE